MSNCDFHIHSTYSDGRFSPKEIVETAHLQNVKYLSLTDHDTVSGLEEAKEFCNKYNIKFIPGIELSTIYNGESVHMLGYFKDNSYLNQNFIDYLQSIKDKRIKRAEEMIYRLKKYHNIELSLESILKNGKDTIARPHIAEAIINAGYDYSKDYIFDNFIGNNCKAYVPANKLSTEDGLKILKNLNAICILAHPILLKKNKFEDVVNLGFHGLEGVYSLNSKEDTDNFLNYVNENNLLCSCGSDFHGIPNDTRHGTIGSLSLSNDYLNNFLNSIL